MLYLLIFHKHIISNLIQKELVLAVYYAPPEHASQSGVNSAGRKGVIDNCTRGKKIETVKKNFTAAADRCYLRITNNFCKFNMLIPSAIH